MDTSIYENRRTVLLISNSFAIPPHMYSGVCVDLARRLEAAGWTVLKTSPRSNRILRALDMVATAWRTRHEFDVAQIDVFSGPAFLWAEAVTLILRLVAKPYVLTLRGGNLPLFARKWPGRVRRLLRSAEIVTTPSRYLYDQMRPYCSHLYLLANPLDIQAYPFTAREHVRPRLVWLRAFHEIYNPCLAAEVVKRLQGAFADTHLTMIGPDKGDGSYQSFQETILRLGIEDSVQCPGGIPKEDVPTWLNKGDIFLNTTNVDNTPVSVLEAMACGLCIVSTNVGGIPYLLEHEVDALLVPPDDPDAMAAAVHRILTEPGLAERLSRNARKKAEQFDWSAILPQWEQLLLEVMDKTGHG